ncbi:GH36 C-terminal domain-containing protein [Microbacterium sp. SA39]|uniref:GH36 C-terminal domain-containing protein n=1 Tax=Microbacterium sp. SA39 TaxID=1263625 RepID=UPI001F41B6DA|nr:GH36 C-terminal domain-containing protein [Microbacterium sp. SA39]
MTRLRLVDLDPEAQYRVRPVPELRMPRAIEPTPPPWLDRGHLVLTGAALAQRGIRLPLLGPGQALVLEVERQPAAD